MCLRDETGDFCQVLNAAGLGRVQHDLEENHHPLTDEILERLAAACGLALEDYRARLARNRGKNALMQLNYLHAESVIHWGAYFTFPKECQDYVDGKLHEVPDVPCIDDAVQIEVRRRLTEVRYYRFFHRIMTGQPIPTFSTYPDLLDLLMRADGDLKTGQIGEFCHGLGQQLQSMLEHEVDLSPEGVAKLVDAQVSHLFLGMEGNTQAMRILSSIIGPKDREKLLFFRRERRRLARRRGKKRGRSQARRAEEHLRVSFSKWKVSMKEAYGEEVRRQLFALLERRAELESKMPSRLIEGVREQLAA